MTTHALAMPEYVAQLVRTTLVRMGLEPSEDQDDLITCPLVFENGTVLSLAVLCIAKRGWFKKRPMLSASVVSLADDTRAVQVYMRDEMAIPTGPNDLSFIVKLSAKVTAIAWSLAATSKIGECVSLPGRPPV